MYNVRVYQRTFTSPGPWPLNPVVQTGGAFAFIFLRATARALTLCCSSLPRSAIPPHSHPAAASETAAQACSEASGYAFNLSLAMHSVRTTRLQLMPSVYFFGAPKAGTTSLLDWVMRMPRTFCILTDGVRARESNLWCHLANPNPDAALLRWVQMVLWSHLNAACASGSLGVDKSPGYMAVPAVPSLMRCVLGESLMQRNRFIAVLREPVARLLSQYNHMCVSHSFCAGFGGSAADFGRWVDQGLNNVRQRCPALFLQSPLLCKEHIGICEEKLVEAAWRAWRSCHTLYDDWGRLWADPAAALSVGLYATHLFNWLRFVRRSQVLIISSDALFGSSNAAQPLLLSEIVSFSTRGLNVSANETVRALPHSNDHASNEKHRHQEPAAVAAASALTSIKCETKRALDGFYRPFEPMIATIVKRSEAPAEQLRVRWHGGWREFVKCV